MIKFEVIFDDKQIEKLKQQITRASTEAELTLADQVLKDSNYFLPMRTGTLFKESHIEDGPDGPVIVYPGPYARFLYFGKLMIDPETGSSFAPKYGHKVPTDKDLKIWKSTNPHATSHWFEVAKAMNMDEWEKTARDAVLKELQKRG